MLRIRWGLHHHILTPLVLGWAQHSTYLELLPGLVMKVRVKARTHPWDFPSTSRPTKNNTPFRAAHALHAQAAFPSQGLTLKGARPNNCSLGVRRAWWDLEDNNRNNTLPVIGTLSYVGTCKNHFKSSLHFYFIVPQETDTISTIL
jgi:hypothetical protein